MKVLFLNAGNETGGGMVHILQILQALTKDGKGQFTLAVLEEGKMKDQAESLGIATVCFSSIRFPFLHELQSYIEKEQFTHIHTHGPRANVWMGFLRGRVNCEWIATVHSNPLVDFAHKGMSGKFMSKIHLRALQKTDKIITVCEVFQKVLLEAGVTSPKMTTIRNGVKFDEDRLLVQHDVVLSNGEAENNAIAKKRLDLGLSDEHIVFVQIARLEAVKAHEHALKAFSKAVKRFPFARLIFVGSGSLEDELKQIAQQLAIDHTVIFLGERDDIADLLELSHVSLLTSISEGFPYVLLEAAQAKKPIIATDVGDIRYLVHEPSVGWLVEAGSEIDVVHAMEAAITEKNKGALVEKGEALYEYARENFSLERSVGDLYGVYRAADSYVAHKKT